MTRSDDAIAGITLRLAGLLQDIKNIWRSRLDGYFSQLESLVDGQWLNSNDLRSIIRESRMASREAIDGLGNDLSSEMLHVSRGIVERFESENVSLIEEITDLRNTLTHVLSGDDNEIRRENKDLRDAIMELPEFRILEILQNQGCCNYKELSEISGYKRGNVRSHVKTLVSRGYAKVNKKKKPHQIEFLAAPWHSPQNKQDTSFQEAGPLTQSNPPQM